MSEDTGWIPLFPLNAVLFPEGLLSLRIFETRYIDMVRECIKRKLQFGVALIRSGSEVDGGASPESVGCLAHIEQWDMPQSGILLLRTRGGARFRILETRVLPDRRLDARIEILPDDTTASISNTHVRCASALKNVIENVLAGGSTEPSAQNPFPEPMQLSNASWVGNRWCEILPISLIARQKLLELDDAETRLEIVHQYLQQRNIL
ncbi:MAG TPA: LON peptidase substrate-binding domain-containing protein [Burkholderiaceae bacterium]|nr:LON peptidase substrate-binding domain-containing protein [Burkholderiaceae bacterium]